MMTKVHHSVSPPMIHLLEPQCKRLLYHGETLAILWIIRHIRAIHAQFSIWHPPCDVTTDVLE